MVWVLLSSTCRLEAAALPCDIAGRVNKNFLSSTMKLISANTNNAFSAISGSTNYIHLFPQKKNLNLLDKLHRRNGAVVKSFANRNYAKKKTSKQDGEGRELRRDRSLHSKKISSDEDREVAGESSSGDDLNAKGKVVLLKGGLDAKNSISTSSRSVVLQACTVTSGLILALGLLIRQVSHIAFIEGFPVLDCSTELSFKFEMWHLELITGLVILISSCRYLLLLTWPDFAESSEAANQQVLSSLQPLDYLIVAFLPGISEELLFRGALLPLFGINWKSALTVAVIFGALHLGSGRKYSFAVWATFVGFAYGYATILSSSILVPVTSHALNNLIGGILWRYTSATSEERESNLD